MKDINREDVIFIILIGAIVINMVGNSYQKKNRSDIANKYYISALIITIIIYFYFLHINYNTYINALNKYLFRVKLLGTCFLIAGALCLLYFQINDPNSKIAPVI